MEFSKIDPWSSKGSEKKNVLSYLVSIGGGWLRFMKIFLMNFFK
jgi:hypothetical protein